MWCKTNVSDETTFKQLTIGREYEILEEYNIVNKKETIPMVKTKVGGFRKEMFSDELVEAPLSKPEEYSADNLPF